jgi:hypothetical protein
MTTAYIETDSPIGDFTLGARMTSGRSLTNSCVSYIDYKWKQIDELTIHIHRFINVKSFKLPKLT